MSELTNLEKLRVELKTLEEDKKKYNSLQAERDKVNNRIYELKKKMSESPSFKLTQELGAFENGRQAFDDSVEQHKGKYEQSITDKLDRLKRLADDHIRLSADNDTEVSSTVKKTLEALRVFLEAHDNLDKLVEDKREHAIEDIEKMGLHSYFEEVGKTYDSPTVYVNPHTFPLTQIQKLKREYEEQVVMLNNVKK